jgi:hypothetical protein
MRFKRKRGGRVEGDLVAVEADVLLSAVTDLLALLGEGEPEDEDPLAALVGLPSGPVETPSDPALARLLPDAHREDEEASREFRRYTEADLRAGKRANAGTVLAALAPLAGRGGRVSLDRDECDAWLGTLNDLRLVLGTRLEVADDADDLADRPPEVVQVYGWLAWLQESLLSCLTPRSPG